MYILIHLTADTDGVCNVKSFVFELYVAIVSRFCTSLPWPISVYAYAATISIVRNLGPHKLNYSSLPKKRSAGTVIPNDTAEGVVP